MCILGRGTGKIRHFTGVSDRLSFLSSAKFYVPLLTPLRNFSVGKRLPLFPSRGRFTLIQVTPARSGSDRWIRILNYHDAHGRVSRPPRGKLKVLTRDTPAKFTILSFRISAAFISNYPDGRNRYFYSACLFERESTKTARLWYMHTGPNNFPLNLKTNGGPRFQFRPTSAILRLITAGGPGGPGARTKIRSGLSRKEGRVTSLPRRISLMFLVSVKLA